MYALQTKIEGNTLKKDNGFGSYGIIDYIFGRHYSSSELHRIRKLFGTLFLQQSRSFHLIQMIRSPRTSAR